ncbi:FusB/FusC family EF-G-binding protein [Enterococcus sp. MJM12]|uniref:FusB/FusC family EF-G-binding protein n=1 Tax=Candidatus Enterococcus myersii TaxID=2815322 RepID=A0ABS3H5H3_9ENTE|nr:FusB/FusC family EF-G-binding protein [Enterococcus sp. MJM12]MBO0448708.1 FusB/FusC family EF-G-binding protein [Enterococcus sp. MJM12]
MNLEPYQFFALAKDIDDLINVYQSVNDKQTVNAVQALTTEKINTILPEDSAKKAALVQFILNPHLTKAAAERYLNELKEQVTPFVAPSAKQVEKVFRKTKKLRLPNFDAMDLKEHTYIGWNDPGQQQKFMLYYENGALKGLKGNFSSNILKNVCSICHKTSEVALFLATTKKGGDGTYTKRGNYICVDSNKCNHQLYDKQQLLDFANKVK